MPDEPNSKSSLAKRTRLRLGHALRAEELAGLKLLVLVKATALFAIGFFLLTQNISWEVMLFYQAMMGIFIILQLIHYGFLRSGLYSKWIPYFFTAAELCLLSFILTIPTPGTPEYFSPQFIFRRKGDFVFYIFVAVTVFSYSPRLVLWTGLWAAITRSVGFMWILSLPHSQSFLDSEAPGFEESGFLEYVLSPYFVDMNSWYQGVIFLLLVSAILAIGVKRSQRLAWKHALSERQRANLARYFSPNVLDEVIAADEPLSQVREHEVAVIFADIVGFTTLCEKMASDDVLALLRDYHSRLEREVFRFGGTMDKFIGDAVMATFGTPRKTANDASNAIRCAATMLKTIDDWNELRKQQGKEAIKISIGVHYGPAIMGDVGSKRNAAYAVIGNTTNTASRLEALTRTLDTDLVLSEALMQAVQGEDENLDPHSVIPGLTEAGLQEIRGKTKRIRVWVRKSQ